MLIKEEKVNLGRQREIDVIKALAILFMILIHVYEELQYADTSEICSAPFDVIIQFLGGPLAAPVFMFSLGLGLAYSSHRSPEDLMARGLKIFLLSYVFNIVRFVIPYLIANGIFHIGLDWLIYYIFHIDILTFAGMAFLLTGLLKKLNVSVFGVLAISIFMQAVGILIVSIFNFDSNFEVYFFGIFVKTDASSYFPLFQWYIYPALGLLFAKYLRHIDNTDKLYGQILFVSAALMFSFCAALYMVGYDIRNLFALTDESYYMQTFLHTFFALGCITIELSIVHFVIKYIHPPKLGRLVAFMSNSLNQLFIAQWLIIGWALHLAWGLNFYISAKATIPVALLITVVSCLAVMLYQKVKKNDVTLF